MFLAKMVFKPPAPFGPGGFLFLDHRSGHTPTSSRPKTRQGDDGRLREVPMRLFWAIFIFAILSVRPAFSAKGLRCPANFADLAASTANGIEVQWPALDPYGFFNFRKHQNIAFLSDGGNSFPAKLLPENRGKNFISTDIDASRATDIVVDNNHLPFKDDSFDLVLMNRGLCKCSPTPKSCMTCGGIAAQEEDMRNFLRSVGRILDKRNPNSLALLTGFSFEGPLGPSLRVPKMWMAAVRDLQREHPDLQWSILYSQHTGFQPDWVTHSVLGDPEHFVGIAVSSRGGTPMSEKIQQLDRDIVFDSKNP